jgi:arylsulfatase A-like enzyme
LEGGGKRPGNTGTSGYVPAAGRGKQKLYEDQPQANVFRLGLEFLEKNKNEDNWFLHLETFDPHEPFFTMRKYKDLYPHDYKGPHFDWPPYGKVAEKKEAVEHLRFQYAALLSMCDAYLGRLLDFMDVNDMWKDTLLIVNTDHGYLLGEHDCWAKVVHPFYEEIAHTPLFVRDPGRKLKAERRKALVQTIDIAPTILEYFGLDIPLDMQGKSLGPVLDNDSPIREGALFGMHGAQTNVTDGRYVYMREPVPGNRPLYEYTHMPTHMRSRFSVEEMRTMTIAPPFSFTKGAPVMKIEAIPGFQTGTGQRQFGARLYDVLKDPAQENPLKDKKIEERMIRLLVELMKKNDCPQEQFIRMGLDTYNKDT